MIKVLIIGRGQIGSALAERLADHDVHIWKHDLDDLSKEVIEVVQPDVIINAAGRTNLAWCEEHAREAMRSNVEAPVRLYQRILKVERPPRFIHFSSGCIWDGPFDEANQPFSPTSAPTPAALYSWTKAACDSMLMDIDPNHIAILRPRQVYSSSSSNRNTLVKLLGYPKLIHTPNSMSSMNIIERSVRFCSTSQEEWSGLWNVYDRGVVTPFEVGSMLAAEGLREEPEPLTKEELDSFHKPKRVDTVLYDERLERLLQPNDVRFELQQAIAGLKKELHAATLASVQV